MAVRREKVLLELEDHFTTGMAKAAASTALLNRELNSLSGSSARRTSTELDRAARSVNGFDDGMRRGGQEIDRYSGRLRLLTDAAIGLGPALIPIGAAAVPAIAGLAAGLGAAAGAAGVAALAFNGVGDALKAFNSYQAEPTTENLEAMRAAMEKIGPAGADLVRFVSSLEPELRALQDTAREGMFPGIESGIRSLLPLLPQVQRTVGNIATELGRLMDEAGGALGGSEFAAFFDYLETDAATILSHFARATGNVAQGLADLVVAMGPLSLGFSAGLERMTRSFADWAAGLSQTQGFQNFVDYVRETGPQVLQLFGSLGNALVEIAQAAAPWGSVVLPILTSLADVLATIAASPVGGPLFTAAAGFIALNRAVVPLRAGLAGLSDAFLDLRTSPDRAGAALSRFGGAARIAAGAAGMGLFVAGLHETSDGLGALEGAAGGALAGFAVGGPWGAAIGGAVGALGSLATANDTTSGYVRELTGSLDAQTGALTENSRTVAAKALEDAGALEIADELGISLGLVTEAALGNKDAMAAINAELERYTNVDTAAGVDVEMFKAREAGEDLMHTLKDLSGETDSTVAAQRRVAEAASGTTEAFQRQSDQLRASRKAARETAQGFIGLGDSLDDSKTSLREWLHQLEQQANALEQFADNAIKAAHRGLDQGLIKSLQEAGPAGAMRMKQLANATDTELNKANRAWAAGQEAIRDYVRTIGGVPPAKLEVDNLEALAAIDRIMRELNSIPRSIRTDYFVNQVNAINRPRGPVANADGGTIPKDGLPYADRYLSWVAPGEEIISNRHGEADQFRADRAAGRIPAYANGGTVGGQRRTLEDQLAIAQIMQQIRDLQRSLRKDGKDKLEGLNRRIAELQLKAAEKELRLAQHREEREARQEAREKLRDKKEQLVAAASGLSFDGLVPQEPQTVAQGVRSEINDFRQQILDAGGVWSKELRAWAKDMMATARQYDAVTAAIDVETERRDALVETLNQQQSQLDDLNRTMEAFGARVASNFLTDPFNQSRTVTVSGDPAAVAALAQAQSQLAAVQATGGSGAAAQASRLMQQIALLQGPASSSEQTLTGLDALRNVLETDTSKALAFSAALQEAVNRGLDPTGGLFSQLAASGDLTTAQQLAGLSPAEIDQLEAMFKTRDDAVAQLAAMTTQAVYGEQQAIVQAQIDHQNQLIAAVDTTLVLLNATQAVLGEQVRAGAEAGAALLDPRLVTIANKLDALPRELQRVIRKES